MLQGNFYVLEDSYNVFYILCVLLLRVAEHDGIIKIHQEALPVLPVDLNIRLPLEGGGSVSHAVRYSFKLVTTIVTD